jgi:hypothetical protein
MSKRGSPDFTGYWQRHHRELLAPAGACYDRPTIGETTNEPAIRRRVDGPKRDIWLREYRNNVAGRDYDPVQPSGGPNQLADCHPKRGSGAIDGNPSQRWVQRVGSATLLKVPNAFIEWVGLESPSASAITASFSGIVGAHILFIDFGHKVDVQVGPSETIQIHNAFTTAATGYITLIH